MDLEAELAAFEAEMGAMPKDTAMPVAAAAATTGAPQASAAPAAAAAAAPPASSLKRKHGGDSSEGTGKKQHVVPSYIVAAAAAAAPAQPSPPAAAAAAAGGQYSSVLAADLAAMQQQRHSAAAAATSAAAYYSSAASDSAAAASSSSSSSSSGSGGYITGRVYNGYLASVHPVTGLPMWVEASAEQIAASAANAVIEAQAEAEAAAAQAAALKKQAKKDRQLAAKGGLVTASGGIASGATPVPGQPQEEKHHLRTAAGKVWDDPTLQDWPENDYRIFCGDLGNEVSEQLLNKLFERWSSFARSKVVRDKRTGKSKGFGFASFLDPSEAVEALKECDGKYVGNRPIRLKKSDWTKREASIDKSWTAKHNQFGNSATRGNKKLHLY